MSARGGVRIAGATIIKVNNLTYVVRPGQEGFWFDEATGLVGVDDDDGDTTWMQPTPDGMKQVRVQQTTEAQYQVIEALSLFER